jgi:hypothetical protein
MFRREVFSSLQLEEDGFGFCPEVTAKISKLGVRIREVPISYQGRTRSEGKKIRFHDGWNALHCIIKYNFFRSSGRYVGTDQISIKNKTHENVPY